jgi:glyoxylase-like metal-dependent hydrolase (beta-lactamase superfamily II)
MPLYKNYVEGLPGQIDDLRKRVAAETDAARKATLQVQLVAAESNRASQAELRPTPPNVTLRTQMTLYRGDREIQIRFLGRAHTGGDIVVYLPKEKAVITGDFLTAALSNMSDAFVNEWPATLDELKKLDFDTVLPGHGEAFTDKAKIDYFQAYLRDVWTQVSRFKQQGVSAEDAAKQADLTKHKEHFPTIQGPGVPVIAVTRIYELLDRGAAK